MNSYTLMKKIVFSLLLLMVVGISIQYLITPTFDFESDERVELRLKTVSQRYEEIVSKYYAKNGSMTGFTGIEKVWQRDYGDISYVFVDNCGVIVLFNSRKNRLWLSSPTFGDEGTVSWSYSGYGKP